MIDWWHDFRKDREDEKAKIASGEKVVKKLEAFAETAIDIRFYPSVGSGFERTDAVKIRYENIGMPIDYPKEFEGIFNWFTQGNSEIYIYEEGFTRTTLQRKDIAQITMSMGFSLGNEELDRAGPWSAKRAKVYADRFLRGLHQKFGDKYEIIVE